MNVFLLGQSQVSATAIRDGWILLGLLVVVVVALSMRHGLVAVFGRTRRRLALSRPVDRRQCPQGGSHTPIATRDGSEFCAKCSKCGWKVGLSFIQLDER